MPDLPPAIAAYFASNQNGEAAAFDTCFTPDAVVHDEGRSHRGVDAIKAWHTETMARTPFTTRPLSVHESDGHVVVPTEVSGSFPGSPVTLDHRFTLRDGRIAALEIH